MLLLVTYDVSTQTETGRKRLRKVAKICENYGQRVQNSVFECMIDQAQFVAFRHKLQDVIDEECDSLRFYNFGNNHKTKVQHIGIKVSYDPEGTLII